MATKRKVSKNTKRRTPPAPVTVPAGEHEDLPPIDPERLRAKAVDELLRLIAAPDEYGPDGPRKRKPRTERPPFLLSPRTIAALLDAHDETDELPPRPAEHIFARVLMLDGVFAAACLGIPWPDVLSGCVRLAMGARLPTVEEVAAVRGKAAVAAGR